MEGKSLSVITADGQILLRLNTTTRRTPINLGLKADHFIYDDGLKGRRDERQRRE